mmetsp:Transcript_15451/g.35860  ORF Transcript_15451/g.35860 Transcript_15451/m.35860 type:complete len:618 (+) Transcript_15451:45-1898(+)
MADSEADRGTKRPGDDEPASKAKRSRWGEDVPPTAFKPAPLAPLAPFVPPAPNPAMDAITAAKAAARAALERARLGLAQPKRTEAMHASLILDSDGRLINTATGKAVTDSRGTAASAKVNQAAATGKLNPYLSHAAAVSVVASYAAAPEPSARDARGRRGLHFLRPGELTERAHELRAQAAVDAVFSRPADSGAVFKAEAAAGRGGLAEARATGGVVQLPASYLAAASSAAQLPPLPRVEWWDAIILKRGLPPVEGPVGPTSAAPTAQYELGVDPEKVTAYIEHPPPVEPPGEQEPPPAQPLPLTAKERKKLRTQRRQANSRAVQDQIRAGLVEPPPPKVKLSNLMRALGEQAVADPTAVEARVREQVAARQAAHEQRNADSRLTKEQRREKKLLKAAADVAAGVHVVVYKVSSVASRQQLHKVELNATQLHLTGACLLVESPTLAGGWAVGSSGGASALGGAAGEVGSVVVVEGGAKAQRAYGKLMLRRIKWDEDFEGGEESVKDFGAGFAAPRVRPDCRMVWRGLVAKGYFKQFKVEQPRPPDAVRKFLADRGVAHYWDAAAGFSADGQGLADALEAEDDMLGEVVGVPVKAARLVPKQQPLAPTMEVDENEDDE